jgi:hypothetical protein
MQRLPIGDVFIDRSGEHFSYILEYLRACACNDITFPMPNDARCGAGEHGAGREGRLGELCAASKPSGTYSQLVCWTGMCGAAAAVAVHASMCALLATVAVALFEQQVRWLRLFTPLF